MAAFRATAAPRPGRARLAVACAASLAAACASSRPDEDRPAAGDGAIEAVGTGPARVRVEFLGRGFVRHAGERVPIEEFVLRLRRDVRARLLADRELPGVMFLFPREADDATEIETRNVRWLEDEIRKLGIGELLYEPIDA